MTALEIFTLINKTLDIVIWPATVFGFVLLFRSNIESLVDRFTAFGGQIGNVSFEVSLQEYAEQTADMVSALEQEGRRAEAQAVVENAAEFIMQSYNLSKSDVEYLIRLADGELPDRRWGKVGLVRSGLIELDGGQLTPFGRQFVNDLLRKIELN